MPNLTAMSSPPPYSSLLDTRRSPSPLRTTDVFRRIPRSSSTLHRLSLDPARRLNRVNVSLARLRRAARAPQLRIPLQRPRRIANPPPVPIPEVTGYEEIFDELPPYSRDPPRLSEAPREIPPPPYEEIESEDDDEEPRYPVAEEPRYPIPPFRVRNLISMIAARILEAEVPILPPPLPPILPSAPGYISPQLLHMMGPAANLARPWEASTNIVDDSQMVDSREGNVHRLGSRFLTSPGMALVEALNPPVSNHRHSASRLNTTPQRSILPSSSQNYSPQATEPASSTSTLTSPSRNYAPQATEPASSTSTFASPSVLINLISPNISFPPLAITNQHLAAEARFEERLESILTEDRPPWIRYGFSAAELMERSRMRFSQSELEGEDDVAMAGEYI